MPRHAFLPLGSLGKVTLVAGIPGTRIRQSLEQFVAFSRDSHQHQVTIHSLESEFQSLARPRVAEF
ncbi:MAG: hypothetical protein O3A10_15985 [Chloroflexi bacterium]|nr:hypothetical protein [Chloroflexota bacterium]MDA1147345.1 hypothetical protein [Chloroflexota bacterium]